MEEPRTDFLLRELEGIKWLLVLIALGLIAVHFS